MTFSKREGDTEMADFSFDQSTDDISSPETYYPAEPLNTLHSRASSPTSNNYIANSHFPIPTCHDTKWLCFDAASKGPYFPRTMSLPVDVPTYSQPRWDDVSNHSSLGSVNSEIFALSDYHHVGLAKITEYETWSVSNPINEQKAAKNPASSYPPVLASYQQDTHPSPVLLKTEHAALPRPPLARASSGSGKSRSRSASSQNPCHPKRRMSASGTPETSPSTPITDSGLPVADVGIIEPKAKNPAKVSHSITERRYRENLNAKIVQLDQTLSLTRDPKDRAQRSVGQDTQHVETAVKPRKADVLNEAMRYVKQAEHDSEARTKEIEFLRLRVAALEKLVNCGDCALSKQYAAPQMSSPTEF